MSTASQFPITTVAQSNLSAPAKTRIRSWWEGELAKEDAQRAAIERRAETNLAEEGLELVVEDGVAGAVGWLLGTARAHLKTLDVKVPLIGEVSLDGLVVGGGAAGSLAAASHGNKWLAAVSRHASAAAMAIRMEREAYKRAGGGVETSGAHGEVRAAESADAMLEDLRRDLGG